MREIVREGDPSVLRPLPSRYRRRWEVGVMKSTDGNADTIWPNVGLPKHRRSARRTKMHPNLSSLLPVADIDVGLSFGANMFLLEKGTHAEHRTSSPLTLATMADAYNIRIGGYFDTQGTATAMRSSRHSAPSLSMHSETTGGRLSERPLTWPVVGPVGGGPSSAVGRATDASIPQRSSRWAVGMPMCRMHRPRHHRPLGCGPLPNKVWCRNSGKNEI